MFTHPFLAQLDASLMHLRDPLAVRFAGQWSSAARRTYEPAGAGRSTVGRLADVVDLRWHGGLEASRRIGAVAFLLTAENLYWAKAPQISSSLTVDVSLHAYADFQPNLATFVAGVASAWLPGIAIPVAASLAAACVVDEGALATGRVTCLARTQSAAVFALLIPGELLQVGRKRIWRIRDRTPFAEYPAVEEFLTHARTGIVPSAPG